MPTPYPRYSQDSPYAYACGVFPCMELMRRRPQAAYALLWDRAGMENRGLTELIEMCRQSGIRTEEAPAAIRRVSGKENAYAVMAFKRFDDVLNPLANHVVLCHTANMGNLGTMLRTALGFGFNDVAVIRPCADPFAPQAVRAAMGAQFGLRLGRFDGLDAYLDAFPPHSRTFVPLALTEDAVPLDAAARSLSAPYSILLGNEASGLPEAAIGLGQPAIIPHNDAIDSLNVAVAAGIAMYALSGRS